MQSPIAALQRATYPREPHPMGPVFALRGFGLFGGTGLNQGVTGLKTGVTSAGIATSIGGGAASALGFAAAGSVVPVIGTAIGLIVGIIASGVFNRKKDKEDANFQQAMAIYRQNPNGVFDIGNKYLVLAGLFDLHPDQIKGNIPIYKKYGRMGEQKFVTDMMTLIYQAGQAGQITANDTPQSVFSRIVQPWIDGFGYGPMVDSNSDMISRILLGMTAEYVMGGQGQWYAVGGQYPFTSLPKFALPVAAAYTPTTSGTPTAINQPSVPTPVTAPAQPAVQQTSAVAVPAGFTLVGSANNLPAYQGPDGAFYSWSGTTMSPLTGMLYTSSGQSAQISGGYPIQPQTAAPQVPYQMLAPSQTQAGTSYMPQVQAAAPSAVPISAGVTGSGLPSWLPWGAAAGVLVLMFATARPIGPLRGGNSKRSRR